MNQSMHSSLVDNDRLLQMSNINNMREDVMGEDKTPSLLRGSASFCSIGQVF